MARSVDGPDVPRAYVRLTEPAVADLERLLSVDPQIVRWALKKMLLLERDPHAGRPLLGSLIGWRKLVVGDRDWRIVWRVTTDDQGSITIDIAEVWAVGARADAEVYDEMDARLNALGSAPPATALADVVARLGRTSASITASPEPVADPVPPWLLDRLVRQVGLTTDDVRAMRGAKAMQLWENFLTSK